MIRFSKTWPLLLSVPLAACGGPAAPPPAPVAPEGPVARATAAEPTAPPEARQPLAPPQAALQLGLMPLDVTFVSEWRRARPTADGRGVLIAILDSGVDLGVMGLQTTSTGQRKVLDLRDVSGEGDVALRRVQTVRGVVVIDSTTILNGATIALGLADDSVLYGGVLHELPFGEAPAADFNGNGAIRDRYGIVVVRSNGRWVALIDTNGDGSLSDETPLSDFLVRQETFTFSSRYVPRGRGPITGAVNLSEVNGEPRLSIFLDTSGHGTHVAGIAAAQAMYGLAGLDGIAPGAQLIGVKLANNARGGVTSNGSMLRAMEYAVRFARERRLPLVINISFGIGNEQEGRAAMDSIVDAFALAHPDVLVVIAAGNDGPGTSTVGLPGSAEFALTAGAIYPGAYAAPQFGARSDDLLGWWSSRGGETAKPDVVVPGMAYSTVPRWNTGDEVKLGTSMAAPYLSGMAALLLSAAIQEGRPVRAADLAAALRASARSLDAPWIDEGAGIARMDRAWRALSAGRPADLLRVSALTPRTLPPGMRPQGPDVPPAHRSAGPSAHYFRSGLGAADSVVRFRVSLAAGEGTRQYRLRSDAAWARPVRDSVTLDAATRSAVVDVRIDRAALRRPGRHVAAVTGVLAADSGVPVFRLVTTVIVPDTSPRAAVTARKLSGGGAARTFVTVPAGASGLAVRAQLRGDTNTPAQLFLYEPSGRPARTNADEGLGGEAGAGAAILATANDVVPGVYEIVMQAMPGREVNYDLAYAVPAIRVAAVDSLAQTVTFAADSRADTVVQVTAEQIGVTTSFTATVERGAAWTRAFTPPEWARSIVVEVAVTPEQWNDVTDFAISVFDGTGLRLGGGAMNYAFHRVKVDLPERRAPGYQAVVELFPGFARPVPPEAFPAQVRVVFEGRPQPLGAPLNLPLRAGGSASYELPAFTSQAGEGWHDWIRVRAASSADDWIAVLRAIAVPRR
jgi:tripeptidyl-peptidase II